MTPNLKLTIELVPSSTWYQNLRNALPLGAWRELRLKVLRDFGHQCGICGAVDGLECHEVWEYDDADHVQTLKGFIALCPLCHAVKHLGLTGLRASTGQLDYEKVVQHFMEVNNCDRLTFERHRKEAFEEFQERSRYDWVLDISASLLPQRMWPGELC